MRTVLKAALVAAAFSVVSSAASAKDAPVTPLFAKNEVLHLTLRGEVNRISRAADAKPVAGMLTVVGDASESLPIELTVRGITRRRTDICPFPPLRVEFTKKPAATSIFKGQNSLKLVTHCRPAEAFQQNLLLEYSAYLMYNAVTPDSFKARLAMVDYVGDDGRAITSRYGFFLEDVDDVADRNGQKRLRNVNRVSFRQLDPKASERFAFFEYMIGNLDWAMNAAPVPDDCCHNSRLVGAKGAKTDLIPVPYDFDFSGLVNAPYAVPPPQVKVPNVRVRAFRGFCLHNELAPATAADFLARRASILAAFDQIPQLDNAARQRATAYLGEFFDRVGSPAQVTEMTKTCLGPRS